MSTIVTTLPSRFPGETGKRPAHHLDDHGHKFCNPHPSYRNPSTSRWSKFWFTEARHSPSPPSAQEVQNLIPRRTPTWGAEAANAGKIKATWLGHAAFFVELPTPEGAARGPRILFDPALSHRCSPSQWAGPARFTQVPCKIEDIPPPDAIVISHNHYDHLDSDTLRTLRKLHNPHLFCPLGNDALLASLGFASTHAHSLDWWDARQLAITLPPSAAGGAPVHTTVTLTCTPAQHTANRTPFDRWHSLWSSWAVEGAPGASAANGERARVFFGGDTGYRTVEDGEDEEKVPVNPDFAEIGRQFGGFDLALLPIGAYEPRGMFSCMHASPADSVRIFQDVRAKQALGMHWGTWTLTTEPVMEPPQKLKEACVKADIAPGVFDICDLGETRLF